MLTEATDTMAVRDSLMNSGVVVESADLTMMPQNLIELTAAGEARQVLKVIDMLDDHDDVQGVYANFDVPDSVMAELEND